MKKLRNKAGFALVTVGLVVMLIVVTLIVLVVFTSCVILAFIKSPRKGIKMVADVETWRVHEITHIPTS